MAKPLPVMPLPERAKPLSAPPSDLAVDAAVAHGEKRGRESVEALEDEHGSLYVIGLLHSDHDWAEDARARRFHLRANVAEADSDAYYEAFWVAARGRAQEIEGELESLGEARAERACER